MVKLCVGVDTVEELEAHVRARLAHGGQNEQTHVTRVTPRRAHEILDGGSLYWVIRGQVQVRQPILRFDGVKGEDGIDRCRIVLQPLFNRTRPVARRPFQGWRYLTADDAPLDLDAGDDLLALPADLRRELIELGLL